MKTLLPLLLVWSCKSKELADTRVLLSVTFTAQIDQLRVQGFIDAEPRLGPAEQPFSSTGFPLSSPRTISVVVPDDLDGVTLTLRVEGLWMGQVRSFGTSEVRVAAKREAPVTVDLATMLAECDTCTNCATCSHCAQCQACATCTNCAACPRCEQCQTCENCGGCCDAGTCVTATLGKCGAGGEACMDCGNRADSCTAGDCSCGGGPACSRGQRCLGGLCTCDAESCLSGCCDGNICTQRSMSNCGTPGSTCSPCSPNSSDNCSAAGTCACGANAPCGVGQRCMGGVCLCDGTSCPDGCCDTLGVCQPGTAGGACGAGGGKCDDCAGTGCSGAGICGSCTAATCPGGCCSGATCNVPSVSACGLPGLACFACDPLKADTCSGGSCKCGTGAPCADGQECVSGVCQCNPTSCPVGCCTDTEQCVAGTAQMQCGRQGESCGSCGADQCIAGANGGVCPCETCSASQCCSGGECRHPGAEATTGANFFCGADTACTQCSRTLANGCNPDGTCACGMGAACVAGQHCAGSGLTATCECDETSCPDGCCETSTQRCQQGNQNGACGKGGAACDVCTGNADAPRCENQVCSCGRNPACGAGLDCSGAGNNARCECTLSSCSAGCCKTDQPIGPSGATGDVCDTTPDLPSDDVDCRASTGAVACTACAADRDCVGGVCHCTATSCSGGCCNGDTCVLYASQTVTTCGTGATCGACGSGQACVGGACVCNETSCPNGCCNGATCVPFATQTVAQCGSNGDLCIPCEAGQACQAGVCGCTAASCAPLTGCCAGTVCNTAGATDPNACGVTGLACVSCAPSGCMSGVCTP